MIADIKRIGVGNGKFPSVSEETILEPTIPFDFSTEEITFDDVFRTFDENPT
jgi:hypothetical protein